MPEINHKTTTSMQQASKEVTTEKLAEVILGTGVTADDLEKKIEAILAKKKQEAAAPKLTKELDWSKISESDIYDSAINIPVIEHDIPDYMNMQLKDSEYAVVWASKDQRRLGQLFAEGYEFLRPEDVHPSFKVPLVFTGDKQYEYLDVVALKVHKRILYGKRRRAFEISQKQLKNTNRPPRHKSMPEDDFALDPGLSLYEA